MLNLKIPPCQFPRLRKRNMIWIVYLKNGIKLCTILKASIILFCPPSIYTCNEMNVYPLRELGEAPLVSNKTISLSGLPLTNTSGASDMCAFCLSLISVMSVEAENFIIRYHSYTRMRLYILPLSLVLPLFYFCLHSVNFGQVSDAIDDFLLGFPRSLRKKYVRILLSNTSCSLPKFLPPFIRICLSILFHTV